VVVVAKTIVASTVAVTNTMAGVIDMVCKETGVGREDSIVVGRFDHTRQVMRLLHTTMASLHITNLENQMKRMISFSCQCKPL
jgi:hypothetical protein